MLVLVVTATRFYPHCGKYSECIVAKPELKSCFDNFSVNILT
jgi:hypothetical protein